MFVLLVHQTFLFDGNANEQECSFYLYIRPSCLMVIQNIIIVLPIKFFKRTRMSVLLVHQTFLSAGNAKHHNNFTYKIF